MTISQILIALTVAAVALVIVIAVAVAVFRRGLDHLDDLTNNSDGEWLS